MIERLMSDLDSLIEEIGQLNEMLAIAIEALESIAKISPSKYTARTAIEGPFKWQMFESYSAYPKDCARVANQHLREIMKDAPRLGRKEICDDADDEYPVWMYPSAPRYADCTHTCQIAPWTIRSIKDEHR